MVQEKPWFADMTNYKVFGITPENLNWKQKNKFLEDTKQYVWDDPYLFQIWVNHLLRRHVSNKEVQSIIWHCHNSPYRGYYNGECTITNVLQSIFYWSSIFKDTYKHTRKCESCQRIRGFPEEMRCHYRAY